MEAVRHGLSWRRLPTTMPAMRLFPAPAVALALALTGCAAAAQPGVAVIEIGPALPSSAAPEPPRAPTPILGHWRGVGRQSSGATWPMEVEITSLRPGRCARVRYPSIPCAAEWICTTRSDGTTLRAREHVTENRRACIDAGMLTMTVAGDHRAEWAWEGSGERAHARLTREPGRR